MALAGKRGLYHRSTIHEPSVFATAALPLPGHDGGERAGGVGAVKGGAHSNTSANTSGDNEKGVEEHASRVGGRK